MEPQDGPATEHPNGGKRPRILVVEDTMIVADELVRLLSRNNYDCVGPVSTVEGACDAARDTSLDGALLDVNLNGRTVYPAADALLARGVPVVFLTAYCASSMPPVYRDVPFLEKPFGAREFMSAVETSFPKGVAAK